MILGRHMDGRVLGYDESAYRFDLAGHPVTAASLEALDKMGLIAWGSPAQREWFVGVGAARFDSVATQVASAAAMLEGAQPAAEQPAEQPVAAFGAQNPEPVWDSQPLELDSDSRVDPGASAGQTPAQPGQPGFAAAQPPMPQPAAQPYAPYPQPRSDRPVPPVGWTAQGQDAGVQQQPQARGPLPQQPQQWQQPYPQQPQQPAAWQPTGQQQWPPYAQPGYQAEPQDQRKRGRTELVIIIVVFIVIAVLAIVVAWMLGTVIGHEIVSGVDPLTSLPNGMDGFNT